MPPPSFATFCKGSKSKVEGAPPVSRRTPPRFFRAGFAVRPFRPGFLPCISTVRASGDESTPFCIRLLWLLCVLLQKPGTAFAKTILCRCKECYFFVAVDTSPLLSTGVTAKQTRRSPSPMRTVTHARRCRRSMRISSAVNADNGPSSTLHTPPG